MARTADRRLVERGLTWLVIVVSLALLTPWGIAQRHSLEPKFALVAIIFGTLSCAAFLVTGAMRLLTSRSDWGAAVGAFCIACSSFLVVATFMWAGRSPTAQSYTLSGAALFMITAAVLQLRARDRSASS